MWIRLALLLLCCLYEQTTASSSTASSSTASEISNSFNSTASSTDTMAPPSTDSSTTSPPTAPSTTSPSTTFSTNTSTTMLSNNTTTSANVNTEATTSTSSKETTSLTGTVTSQSTSSASTTTKPSSPSNPDSEISLESTTTSTSTSPVTSSDSTDNTSTTTNPRGTSNTSHSNPPISSVSMDTSTPVSKEPAKDLGIILPAAIVPVVVCSVVALMVFLYLRHSRKRKAKGGTDKKVTSKPIDILDFENVLRDMNANSQLKYSEEFMALAPVGKEYSKDVAGLEANREKNRYTDIKPYDISRVKLSINPEDESDYINASWIPGYFSRRQYIAAQGPMPSTQDDFWRMVWEYNSRIIVMLTKTMENNRIKCCQYWPSDKEVVMYGDIAVSIIGEIETDSWIVREMNVSMGQQKRLVKQCFFTKWPDMKTPEDSSSIIDFIRMVRSYCPIRGSSPLIAHCSAGVGRTGAFIALDTAMYQIEEEEKVDIFGIVYKMRLNRVSMVQNERQYIFIYETVADIIRNYQGEKKKKLNGQVDFFMGDMPKNDPISNNLIYQNIDTSNSALVINEDVRNLL